MRKAVGFLFNFVLYAYVFSICTRQAHMCVPISHFAHIVRCLCLPRRNDLDFIAAPNCAILAGRVDISWVCAALLRLHCSGAHVCGYVYLISSDSE